MTGHARSPLAWATAGVFLHFTCWRLLTPLVPLWAGHLGATPLAIGALLTGYALTDFACAPVLGALSDRLGRRPIIVASLGLSAAAFAMTALATSLVMLFAAQLVGGLGAGIVCVAQAVVADQVHPDRLAHAMAYLFAAIGVANVAGPALGGVLSELGATVPFWSAAGLALAATALMAAALPETRRRRDTADTPAAAVHWRELLRPQWIHRLAVVALIFGCVIVTLDTVLVLFTNHLLGWTEAPNEWLFAYLGAVVVTMQLVLVGRCAARFGAQRVLAAGLLLAALGLLLLGVSPAAVPVLIGVGLSAVGIGLVAPLLPTLFCFASPVENRGAILGLAQGVIALARLVGPLMATAAFTWSIGAPFVIAGLLCLPGVALLAVGSRPASGVAS